MRRFVKTGLLAGALLASSWASSAQAEDIRIGITIRMISETGYKYGKLMTDMFDDINEAGGINGHKLDVKLLNDECKSDKGIANANRLIHQDRVHLLIGSTCSSVTLPVVDVATKAEVPEITPHSTNAEITKKGSPWVFRAAISSRFFNGVSAKYVAENIGKRLAYIYATDAASEVYATGVIDLMRKEYGVEPVYVAAVQEREVDFRSHLLKIKAEKPDALVISALAEPLARALTQSYEVGIPNSVARTTSSSASSGSAPRLAGEAIVGVFHASAFAASDDRPIVQDFVKMVQERYGVIPDHDFSNSWDTVKIVEQALKNADLKLDDASLKEDRIAIRDALAEIQNYNGLAAAPISFCADPTPQCRDGSRAPVLIEFIKGGDDFETKVLTAVELPPDFGL